LFETALNLYAFNLEFCERQCVEFDSGAIYRRPSPSLHAPAWILGHLAIATDWAGSILGIERACPASWHRAFSPGTTGEIEIDEPPSKEQLLGAIRRGHERVAASISTRFDPARMSQPHAIALLNSSSIRTLGDALMHLLTTHEAMHLGQLSMCRRATGLQAIF